MTGVPVRYSLSTNDLITTADPQLGTTSTFTLSRDGVSTVRKNLTIPATAAFTNYWIGAHINPNGTIAESDTGNNASYIGIRVIP